MDDVELHAGKVELAQFRFDLGRIAHQQDVQVMKPGGLDGARHHHGRPEIASHGIHGYDGARVHYSASFLATT